MELHLTFETLDNLIAAELMFAENGWHFATFRNDMLIVFWSISDQEDADNLEAALTKEMNEARIDWKQFVLED